MTNNENPVECMRYIINGRVQGVFYRVSTREQARLLGLTGWVRNLDDGSVEVLACGSNSQLMEFVEWLRVGPPYAKVTDVSSESFEPDATLQGFETR
ncbi:MAG: acylphosphatase [Gammaproteobacteria bacterium]